MQPLGDLSGPRVGKAGPGPSGSPGLQEGTCLTFSFHLFRSGQGPWASSVVPGIISFRIPGKGSFGPFFLWPPVPRLLHPCRGD